MIGNLTNKIISKYKFWTQNMLLYNVDSDTDSDTILPQGGMWIVLIYGGS